MGAPEWVYHNWLSMDTQKFSLINRATLNGMAIFVYGDLKNHLKPSFRNAFSTTLRQFCNTSSIHGIKYFYDSESNFIGKFIWIVTIMTTFFCANAMVYSFYMDFESSPIRMNMMEDHSSIAGLEFPAVTICPQTMYNHQEVKTFFKTLALPHNISLDDATASLNQLYALVGKMRTYDEHKLAILQKIIDLNGITTLDFVKAIRWKCSDFIFRCRFQTTIVDCNEIFETSKTHTGYCCSFNINQLGLNYPKYTGTHFGPEGGLSIILSNNQTEEDDYHPLISSEHELIVHQSQDFPHRTMTSNWIPVNQEIFTSIRPTEKICSEEFKALPVRDRQCLLPHEHNFRFFNTYNSDNCEFECRTISIFDKCGCIPYFIDFDSKSKVCDFTQLSCLIRSFDYFGIAAGSKNNTNTHEECYCPNRCQSTEYDVQITHAELQTLIEPLDSFYLGIQQDMTVLHVYFNSQVYKILCRDTLSDLIILIGNLGSSYSLFVGMSMISLLEIIYFFTLVFWKNYGQQIQSN